MAGPRYTSYPTAPQFHSHFSDQYFYDVVVRSNHGPKPLSLYMHIPFCETLCFYYGCNKVVTPNKTRAAPYLQYLAQEIAARSALFDAHRVGYVYIGMDHFAKPNDSMVIAQKQGNCSVISKAIQLTEIVIYWPLVCRPLARLVMYISRTQKT